MRERRSSSANNSSNSGSNKNNLKNHNSLFEMWEQRCNSEMSPEQRQQQQQQHSSRSPQRKPIFPDWRQDTPFWNKQVCPVKPNPKAASSGHRRFFEEHSAARAYEEPWFYYQQYASPPPPPPPQMVEQRQPPARYKHPVNGGNGYMFVSSTHGGADPTMYLPAPAFPPHHAYHVEYPFMPRTTRATDRRSVSSGSSGGGRVTGRSPFRNEFRLEITELEDEEKVDSDPAAESDFEEEFPDGEAIRYDDHAGRKPARGMEAQSHILDFPSGIY